MIPPPPPLPPPRSYRDPRNPECVRFPGSFVTRTLIGGGLLLVFLTALLCLMVDRDWTTRVSDAAVLAIAALLLLCTWPSEILSDQVGLHELGLFGHRWCFLAWKEIARVEPARGRCAWLAAALRLRADVLVISDESGRRRIVHTPRHPDRERLLHEMRAWGVACLKTTES